MPAPFETAASGATDGMATESAPSGGSLPGTAGYDEDAAEPATSYPEVAMEPATSHTEVAEEPAATYTEAAVEPADPPPPVRLPFCHLPPAVLLSGMSMSEVAWLLRLLEFILCCHCG